MHKKRHETLWNQNLDCWSSILFAFYLVFTGIEKRYVGKVSSEIYWAWGSENNGCVNWNYIANVHVQCRYSDS